MADIYRPPKTRRLFDGGIEPANPIRIGAVTAVQVSAGYSGLFLTISVLSGKQELSVVFSFLMFTALSAMVAILFTLSLGLLTNSVLHRIGQPYPLWFCMAVLIAAGLLRLLGVVTGSGSAMDVVAIAVCLYGLPIAWIASSRMLKHQRLYDESLAPTE